MANIQTSEKDPGQFGSAQTNELDTRGTEKAPLLFGRQTKSTKKLRRL